MKESIELDFTEQARRVLFVSPFVPYPLDDGLKIRAFNTMKQMCRRGYTVTLLCYVEGNTADIADLSAKLDIEVVSVPFKKTLGFVLSHFVPLVFSMNPYTVSYYRSNEFSSRLHDIARHRSFDCIYIYTPYLIADAVCLSRSGASIIIDAVDCQSLSMMRGYQSAKRISHRIYWLVNYLKWKIVERQQLPLFDCILVSAERDVGPLKMIMGRKVQVLSHGVDTSYWKPSLAEKEQYSMVFAGTMDAFANSTAVVDFVNDIFPLVKERIPQARLYIAGKNPPREVQALAEHTDVCVLGYVRDLRDLVDRCEIVVCPLRMATGIQTKILEAMAMNKPIVASKISLGDVATLLTSDDVVVAEPNEEFAERIVELLSNRERLEELGKNGRAIVEKHFTWMRFGEKLNDIILEVMKKRKHGE